MNVQNIRNGKMSIKSELNSDFKVIREASKETEEKFKQYLQFGTGGMRGLLGNGSNRINILTIRRVAKALSLLIKSAGENAMQRGVVIAFDTRHYSQEFALEAAKVIRKFGICVYLFKESRPTPELSFSIRYLQAYAGVVITASHNPAQYNGFKVFGEDGGQLSPAATEVIVQYMKEIEESFDIQTSDENELINSKITYLLEEIDNAYQEYLLTLREDHELLEKYGKELSIVYTPLHGTGLIPVKTGLQNFGFSNVSVVPKQSIQDPNFSTVLSPNPGEHDSFSLAIKLGKQKCADILLATDPDADRLGVAVQKELGEYVILTGNQLGALLLHYILKQKDKKGELPKNGVLIKTIVTSDFGRAVATKFGIKTIDTLTGFKYIAEKIEEFTKSNEFEFLFGYEESSGFLIGDFIRDKDAIQAALLTAEMATFYKSQGKSMYEVLYELYNELGHFRDSLKTFTIKGREGQDIINIIMSIFRDYAPCSIAGYSISTIEDYKKGMRFRKDGFTEWLSLPKEDVVKIFLEDGSWICIRPSGTEPICKFYFGVQKETASEAEKTKREIENDIIEYLRCFDINI